MRKRSGRKKERQAVQCVSLRYVPARNALLFLLFLLQDEESEEGANENGENERGGLRVALLRGVFVRGGRTIYRVPGTGFRVPSTRYRVLGSQVGRRRAYREESSEKNGGRTTRRK